MVKETKFFRKQAAKAERMAQAALDPEISQRLLNMAKAYRSQADVLKAKKKSGKKRVRLWARTGHAGDQQIDLPNAINEGQHQRDGRPHDVHRDQESAARQKIRKAPDHGRHADICNHLDRKCSSEHGACLVAGNFEGQQPQRNRHHSGAY
jgi:hypothetical protein